MERKRSGENVVRADQVAPVVPRDARRSAAGRAAVQHLRRPGLLKDSGFLNDPASLKERLRQAAHDNGFDTFGVTAPDAVPDAKARLERFIADGAHGDMIWMETTA